MSLFPGYNRKTTASKKSIKRNNALLECLKMYGLDEAYEARAKRIKDGM